MPQYQFSIILKLPLKLSSIIALICLSVPTGVMAERAQLPTVQVEGRNYYYYDVQPKETIFSISQRLGLTRQQIIDANPSVADGLQAYTRLYFPVESGEITSSVTPVPGTTHKVEKGETLYGISHRYGVTVDDLISLNPTARDGVKQGQVLIITTDHASEPETPVIPAGGTRHVIAKGETLYRIAADNGITVEQLLVANPGLDAFNYSTGTEIIIPGNEPLVAQNNRPVSSSDRSGERSAASSQPVTTPEPPAPSLPPVVPGPQAPSPDQIDQTTPSDEMADRHSPEKIVIEEPAPKGPDSFDVAVMLPFMLSEENESRASRLYTDFYRGFLLAAKELSASGTPIRIHAFDTSANNDSVAAILSSPAFRGIDLVVGPDNEQHLSMVINGVDEDSTFIFNPFVVRNTAYTDHANVIQPNIPQEAMFSKAADAYIQRLDGRTPVFIARKKGHAEKEGFVAALKSRLGERAIDFREITFSDALSAEDLASLDSIRAYAFIPYTGQRTEFLKFKDALLEFGKSNPSGIMMLGYPDWVTFRADLLEDLSALNTVIYSRFFYDPDYSASKEFMALYKKWYGNEPVDGAPLQAALGYDSGRYLFKTLRDNGGDFHLRRNDFNGIQNSFLIDDSDSEGLVNTSLLLIHFKPDGLIERTEL